MDVKYIVKEENEIIGYITEDYRFTINKGYHSFILPYPLMETNTRSESVKEFLKTRVISKDSDMIETALEKMGLMFYDVEQIIKKTRGQTCNDKIWIAFNDKEKWEDVSFSINTDMTTLEDFEP